MCILINIYNNLNIKRNHINDNNSIGIKTTGGSKKLARSVIRVNEDVHQEIKSLSKFLNLSVSNTIQSLLIHFDKDRELITQAQKRVESLKQEYLKKKR